MQRVKRPTWLVIVRHAESLRNHAKRGSIYFVDDAARQAVRGTPDHLIDLTDDGYKQALETGLAVRQRFGVFDHVYTSGYTRAVRTAEGILAAYPEAERERMRVRMDLLIRERDPGFAYDMTEAEAAAAFPWLDEYWKTFGGFMARPPGGESLADVTGRVQIFLETVFREHAGEKVLIVTHAGTIRCFRFALERWDYERADHWPSGQGPANCGVTAYRATDGGDRLELHDYNRVYWNVGAPDDGG